MMLSESRIRCIRACIGTSRIAPDVPVADMVEVFGRADVEAVARSMASRYSMGAADVVLYRLGEESGRMGMEAADQAAALPTQDRQRELELLQRIVILLEDATRPRVCDGNVDGNATEAGEPVRYERCGYRFKVGENGCPWCYRDRDHQRTGHG